MKSISENQKISKKIFEIPTHRKRHDLWNEDFPSFEFSPPRFASRLAAFPSAGRQAALRALTKPVQLAAAPTIASQVRGHAGQTMQEWSMKIWGQFLFDEMLLLLGELLCMLMDVDCDKGCFLPAAMSRWTISCLFRHWIKFYSSSHLLRHRLVRQNCCHRMSSDAQCCRGVKCLISTSSSNCWGNYSASVPDLCRRCWWQTWICQWSLEMGLLGAEKKDWGYKDNFDGSREGENSSITTHAHFSWILYSTMFTIVWPSQRSSALKWH